MTAEEVKVIRRNAKMTQDEFARALNIPINTLRNWEQGRNKPGRRSLLDIKAFQEGQK